MSHGLDDKMSEWINLERLPGNDLPIPKYETEMSAGIDFGACLKRPCILIGQAKSKTYFLPSEYALRQYYITRTVDEAAFENAHGLLRQSLQSSDNCEPNETKTPAVIVAPGEVIMIPLGWKSEFGTHCVMHLHVRSSVGLLGLTLANGTGIIDPDYRGELFAAVFNRSQYPVKIEHGDRVVQGVLLRFNQAVVQETTVGQTIRGEGGFGSTGLKTT